jgi:HEAT repeat protein
VETLKGGPPAESEPLLVTAIRDRDLGVAAKAIAALGEIGGAASVTPLVQFALETPADHLRRVAARALAQNAKREEGLADLLQRTGGEVAGRAYDAAGEMARAFESPQFAKALDKGLAAKAETGVRGSAARLVAGLPADQIASRLPKLLADPDPEVGCAAAEAARFRASTTFLAPLGAYLQGAKISAVVERRVRRALVTIEKADRKGAVADLAEKAIAASPADPVAARFARLTAELAEAPEPAIAADRAMKLLAPLLAHGSAAVRGAAVHALGSVGGAEAAAKSREIARSDADARVRLLAQRSTVRIDPPTVRTTADLLIDRLTYDADPLVREEAAVGLGREKATEGVPALAKAVDRALADKSGAEWAAGTCALVSLGKTRDPGGLPTLKKALTEAKDWRLRASALVGIGWLRNKEAIPILIEHLASKEPIPRAVAFEFLRRLTSEEIPAKQDAWKAWWKRNEPGYEFRDFKAESEKAKKFGYSPTPEGVYEGLDVIVLQSRGDHIEKLLEHLKVEHRITRQGQVPDTGLHPFAIFVSNCTGEITAKDVAPLQWFVRAGGYLFASCWALQKTVEQVYPGVVRKFEIKGQVIDTVPASPCRDASPFLDGVFPKGVTPMYVLEGAFLIEVVDAERGEVLIDSPWTEGKYGEGTLAAWFTTGHGVVLDSVNHFDLQGFERAEGMKTAADRKAYALDHLGLSFDEIRAIPDATWDNGARAAREARDLSAFRFITNFVREKRKWFE